jgi:hypothetical protein
MRGRLVDGWAGRNRGRTVDAPSRVLYKGVGVLGGGGVVVELATLENARRRDRRAGTTLPERLRSALTARGWVRRPEPRVRFGQPVLPGTGALGAAQREDAAAFMARADALRDGRLVHLGRTIEFDGRVDWFPREASREWQAALHGLDELVAVAVAAATAPNPEERRGWYELATTVVRDWGRRVPAGHAIAWGVPALSRRVRNLLLVQALFAAELRKDVETRRDLLARVYEQVGALVAALPGHPADPWLVAAGNALFFAGRFFDGMEARRWVETGTTTLWGQLREQVLEDGGHASRSPGWQAFVLSEYLTTLAALRADNDDVPTWGRKRVRGMADCLARLVHPDGSLPAFDAPAVECGWTIPELLATAAVVLHEPGFAVAPALPGVWPLLVLGEGGRRTYAGFSRTAAVHESRALRRTGFYVLAGPRGDTMIVDGGSRPAADGTSAFGYELSIGGLPMVAGAPVGADEPGLLAEHARTLGARNVLVPASGGAGDAGAIESRFTLHDGVQYFVGTCPGFAGLGPDVRYRRRMFCLPERFWLVCDDLIGPGSFSGESLVHLHPDVSVRGACAGRPVVTIARTPACAMTVLLAGAKSLGIVGGVDDPEPQGWYPTGAGGWRPAPVLVVRIAGALPLLTGYALVPRSAGVPSSLDLQGDAFELRARVRLGDVVHELTAVQDDVRLMTRPA